MTAVNFDAALKLTLQFEGGYVDDPDDPGGATNLGITLATLARWRGASVTKADVKALTRAEAAAIYRKDYWDAVGGDAMPGGVDMVLFDHAVHSGPTAALKIFRVAVGVSASASLASKAARDRIASFAPADLIRALCAARRSFLRGLKTFPKFGKGWTARVDRLETAAVALAAGAPKPNSSQPNSSQPAPKAPAAQEKPMPTPSVLTPEAKPFWASQTIWSTFAVIGSSATGAFIAWSSNDMAGFGASLTALVGGISAMIGRYRAVAPIG
jgi:lysozyme family protein